MGLLGEKAAQSVKDGDLKLFQEKLNAICGCEIPVNFDWTPIEKQEDTVYIIDKKKYQAFMLGRVLIAIKNVCASETKRAVVREKFKALNLIPCSGDVEFTDGILTVRNYLSGQGAYDVTHIQSILENGLGFRLRL